MPELSQIVQELCQEVREMRSQLSGLVDAIARLEQKVDESQSEVGELREQLGMATAEVPAGLLTLEEGAKHLGYSTPRALRDAIYQGLFKSGTEVQKYGRFWRINARAVILRREREQRKRRVC